MKRIISWFLVALTALYAGPAFALPKSLTQNEFTTAESLDPGMTQLGIFVTTGDKYLSYYPGFRYGLGSLLEVGARVGVTSVDIGSKDKISDLLGADLKYQLIKQTDDIPIDMAIDLGYDYTLISGKHVSELTFSTIVSRGFPLTDAGYKLTPYGGIELASQNSSSSYVTDETNFYVFGGLEWRLSQKFMLTAELKGGSSTLGGIGMRFEY
jgi:hypothetical protein